MKKLLFCITFVVLVLGVSLSPVRASSFEDVQEGYEYYNAVQRMTELNIISGYGNKFKPYEPVTRAQSSKMLALTQQNYKLNRPSYDTGTFYFKDVHINDWYYPHVMALKASRILDGYADQTFRGHSTLKRSQAVKLLVETFQIPEVEGEVEYVDVPASASYASYVHTLSELGIVKGAKGEFRPHAKITRAQWAMMMDRAIQWHLQSERVLPGKALRAQPNIQAYEHAQKVREFERQYLPMQNIQYVKQPAKTSPPYHFGTTTDEARKQALNMTNYLRTIAHLPANVRLDNEYNKSAQAGAGIMAILNGSLTHYPARPGNMGDEQYKEGYDGASTSNLGVGYSTVASSIAYGYMVDSDRENRQTVGHRLWVLNPNMKKVGFGYAESKDGTPYTAMKVFENGVPFDEQYRPPFISWPSEGAFPAHLFSSFISEMSRESLPWSVSLSPTLYAPLTDRVEVKLKRVRDQKTWTFSKKKADGYYNHSAIQKWTTGETIIFQPPYRSIYPLAKSETFEVLIEGLQFTDGRPTSIKFSTVIFE